MYSFLMLKQVSLLLFTAMVYATLNMASASVERISLPNAVESFDTIKDHLASKQIALFLDYDGTLTPIVKVPADAKISDTMLETLKKVSKKHTTMIVTGRGLEAIKGFVNLPLHFAASHGFEIVDPDMRKYFDASEDVQLIQGALEDLKTTLSGIDGLQIENKNAGLSVHYRNVPDDARPIALLAVEKAVDTVVSDSKGRLKKTKGKMVLEILPNKKWDKGKAVGFLMEKVFPLPDNTILANPIPANPIPVYIGDDISDEDAFKEVNDREGISILVHEATEDEARVSAARYIVKDPSQVQQLLQLLTAL